MFFQPMSLKTIGLEALCAVLLYPFDTFAAL